MSDQTDNYLEMGLRKLAQGTKYTIIEIDSVYWLEKILSSYKFSDIKELYDFLSETSKKQDESALESKLKEATSIIEDSKNLADLVIEYDLLDYSDFNNDYISFELSDRVSKAWKTAERVDKFLGIAQRKENSWSKKHEYSNPEAIMLRQEKTIQDLENRVKELETIADNLRNYSRSSV